MRRVLVWSAAILGAVVVSAVVFGWLTVRNPFPQTDGTIAIAGLDDEVRVTRDDAGVPHISATSERDLYLAQGYVHAQDRFWQMDVWRHIGQSRVSEMFGSSQVETDAFLRTLGFNAIAVEELAALPEERRQVLEWYAEGVNAWLDGRSGSELSLGHFLVGLLYGHEPEPWEPIHTIAWARMMAWELRSNIDEEIQRVIAADAVGVERAEELYPPFPDDKPTILGGPSGGAEIAAFAPADLDVLAELVPEVAAGFGSVDALLGGAFEGIGSNNWVVSGELTDTGAAYLANDPHLGIQIPSIWYQNALHCEPCDRSVTGFSFAGVPGVVVGHNDRIAWGVTNIGPDAMDLYLERVNPANPDEYEVDGEYFPFRTRTEVIEVAGGDPVEIEVRSTRHGPVLSGVLGAVDVVDAEGPGMDGDPADEHVVSLAWAALAPSTLVDAILSINEADDWPEFREAAAKWDLAPQNVVYADVDGNIGYTATGKVPIRAAGDGRWPVPGWVTTYQWVDWVPFEDLLWTYNPPSGIIATANQPIVPIGAGPWLGRDFAYGYRGARIYDVLRELPRPISRDDLTALQMDGYNGFAEEFLPAVLAVPGEGDVAEAQAVLADWGEGPNAFQQGIDSAGAALWNVFYRQLLLRTFFDELDPFSDGIQDGGYTGGSRFWTMLRDLDPGDEWWDDVGTDAVEIRDDIVAAGLAAAWEELSGLQGDDPADWSWGELHEAVFPEQTLGASGIGPVEAIFNRRGIATGGGAGIVNATGWNVEAGYEVVWLPSFRMVVDLADFDRSVAMHTTGQSGHPYHPHYFDLAERWAVGEYHGMWWSEAAIDAVAVDTLVLVPEE
ncbi:MAG: penicillin acylase family protein [Acidimicrobiia bacterium]